MHILHFSSRSNIKFQSIEKKKFDLFDYAKKFNIFFKFAFQIKHFPSLIPSYPFDMTQQMRNDLKQNILFC